MSEDTNAWRCTVCGYIHRGPEPPDTCPVCGVGPESFEAYVDEVKMEPMAAHAWTCLNCNYVHAGTKPPEECPVCGAVADRFRASKSEARESQIPGQSLDVVVVGGGIAGVSAAEAVRKAAPQASITVLSKEDRLPYYRLNITRLLAGEVSEEAMPLHPQSWYDENNITLRLGEVVASIELDQSKVTLANSEELTYDALILAPGSHPFVPPIPGSHREGVMTIRTTEDADKVLKAAKQGAKVLVLGGGVLGLETAGALARQGASVRIVEGFGWLLPRQLEERAGKLLAEHVEKLGIELTLDVKVKEVVGDEAVGGLLLEGGEILDGDLLVIATGVRPNSYLARQSGLDVHNGVVVDNLLRTSDPKVFAAGDVAEHQGLLYGTWGPSQYMGSIAGMNAAGDQVEFGGIPVSNTLKVLGIDLFSIGVVNPTDASYEEFREETADGKYYRFLFRDSTLVGAILLGDTRLTATVTRLVEKKTDVSRLIKGRPSGADLVEALLEL